MTVKTVVAVIDLQFGSTGKGQIAGTLAHHWGPDTVVTAWGPNAGHTFRNGEFHAISRMVASSAVAPSVRNILLGPGSVLDLEILRDEILDRGARHLQGKHLIIHPQAVVLQPRDAATERLNLERIGSTMKGTAEGTIRKIRREKDAVAGGCADEVINIVGQGCFEAGMSIVISSHHYDKAVDKSSKLLVEGAQGFSLGLHTDFYPHTTGRDVSTAQMFADCRLPFPHDLSWPRVHVIGVARTHPIRVANRYREVEVPVHEQAAQAFSRGVVPTERVLVGTSGGCYPDQEEITWEKIGREVELTTVTQLPRRIFTFSIQQIREAARICRPSQIALTFCDYLQQTDPYSFGKMVSMAAQAPVRILSQGPDISDVQRWMHPNDEMKCLLDTKCDYLEEF